MKLNSDQRAWDVQICPQLAFLLCPSAKHCQTHKRNYRVRYGHVVIVMYTGHVEYAKFFTNYSRTTRKHTPVSYIHVLMKRRDIVVVLVRAYFILVNWMLPFKIYYNNNISTYFLKGRTNVKFSYRYTTHLRLFSEI